MKTSFYALFIFLMTHPLFCEQIRMDIKGDSAILINAETGSILFQKEAHKPVFPASVTKIATALYALHLKENELNTVLTVNQEAVASITPEAKRKSNYTVPAYWLETDGVHIGLKVGEEMAFRDVLAGMLISSGNDAANVIAQHVGGTIPQFMDQLNLYLKEEVGCQHTHFCNPHGLHHPDHQTTAYDLALMAQEALKNSTFSQIVAQPRFLRPKTNKQAAATLLQGNRLIRPGKLYYSKAIGVKTGYHSKAKNTFVGAARYNDRTLIVVLLGYPERQQLFQDAIKLFDTAFNQPKVHHVLLKAGAQKFSQELPRSQQPLQTYLAEDLSLDYYPAEDPKAKCLLYWNNLDLPIQKGQKVGELQLVAYEGKVLKSTPLFASEPVNYKWPYSWTHKLTSIFQMAPILWSLFFLINAFFIFRWVLGSRE